MLTHFDNYLAVFLSGLVVAYLFTPLVRRGAIRLGAVDRPDARRPHLVPTPRGGGIAVIMGVHAACLVALAFPWPQLAGGLDLRWWVNFSLASLVLLVVGLFDDLRGLAPLLKLAGQTLSAVVVALSGLRFGSLLGFPLPPWLDFALVVFWILAAINAFNLIDGLDGLAAGLALISAAGICGIFILQQLPGNVLIMLGLMGACLGFLRYNFHPASIFLGDTGSMFLGLILGTVSLQTYTKSTFLLAITIPMLVLGVPLYDEMLAVWRRSVRKWLSDNQPRGERKRKGIMQPDLDHLHHRLIKAGLSTGRVTLSLYLINTGLVAAGLLIVMFQSHASGIFLVAFLAAVYVLMRHLAVIEMRDTGQAILNGLRRPTHANFKAFSYVAWDMIWMTGSVAFVMAVFEDHSPDDFWHAWFLDLPVWVTPTFSFLAASRVYVTVWTRSRGLDVLMLLMTLWAGLFISLGIALLIEPAAVSRWLVRALIIAGISHPFILGIRVAYRFTEEIVLFLKNMNEVRADTDRIVLYGAGRRCQLFLKERSFGGSNCSEAFEIIGIVDDEPSLHGNWVYGCKVLGGIGDLPRILRQHRINVIMVTATLSPNSHAAVRDLAFQQGLSLREWSCQARTLLAPAGSTFPTPSSLPSSVPESAGVPVPHALRL